MNRVQQLGGGIAIVVGSAAILVLVAHAAPEPATAPTLPAPTVASFAAICNTGGEGRPEPAWMKQSFENDNCWAPQEPSVVDGTKANLAQVEAGMAAAKKFVASANRYQKCISAYLAQRQHEAERTGKLLKVTFVTIETHRMLASEASKKRVSDAITMAIDDFNAEGSECPE